MFCLYSLTNFFGSGLVLSALFQLHESISESDLNSWTMPSLISFLCMMYTTGSTLELQQAENKIGL